MKLKLTKLIPKNGLLADVWDMNLATIQDFFKNNIKALENLCWYTRLSPRRKRHYAQIITSFRVHGKRKLVKELCEKWGMHVFDAWAVVDSVDDLYLDIYRDFHKYLLE